MRFAVLGGLSLLLILGCSRSRTPEVATKTLPPVSPAWLILSKTGGIAGIQLVLEVDAAGRWVARNRGDSPSGADSTRGALSAEERRQLTASLLAIPEEMWRTYASKVYDDFNYQLTERSERGVRSMEGNGQALPPEWRAVIRQLEPPLSTVWP